MQVKVAQRGADGSIQYRRFASPDDLAARYERAGVDEYSIDLFLRGLPVYHGLIGPMPDKEPETVRYETPEIFEEMTKIWATPRRGRRKFKGISSSGE